MLRGGFGTQIVNCISLYMLCLYFVCPLTFMQKAKQTVETKRQAVVKCALTVETEKEILFDSITGKESTS